MLTKLRILELVRPLYSLLSKQTKSHTKLIGRVNKKLMDSGFIKNPLTSSQIQGIVDIHSPTADKFDKNKGIDINFLLNNYLKNFRLEYFDTYNHLCKPTHSWFFSRYDKFLKRRFHKKGATLFVIFKKLN